MVLRRHRRLQFKGTCVRPRHFPAARGNEPMPASLRVVVTADNHLGRYYDRLAPRQLEARRAWLRQGWEAAGECALDRRAHLFLQAGDLFDTPDPRNAERVAVARALARLDAAGVGCYAIGG